MLYFKQLHLLTVKLSQQNCKYFSNIFQKPKLNLVIWGILFFDLQRDYPASFAALYFNLIVKNSFSAQSSYCLSIYGRIFQETLCQAFRCLS